MNHPTGRPIVLIVEDEQLIRMLAVDAFLESGFAVVEAEDAAEALRVMHTETGVQLLFTDVNMPGEMNGIDLAEHLISRFLGLKIIVTSALPMPRPLEHLPGSFVSKPYDIEQVCETAWGLLAP